MKTSIVQQKLSAATLIEAIISLVIIMAVFVSGIAIFAKVTQSGISNSRLVANRQMQSLLIAVMDNSAYEDEVLLLDSITYEKTIHAYEAYEDMVLVKIVAIQNGTVIDSLKQLVRKEEADAR